MPELSKATLQEIDNANQPRAGRAAVSVQFNPGSLRLQYSNQSEGGSSPGRQARQHTGNGAVTLAVELQFDTADEGSTAVPRSVLERTRQIETFIKPQSSGGSNQAPPRLRFHWGDLIIDGVMESLSVDIDHFAHNGIPLRAKASLSIKGQDAERQANASGAGANSAQGTPPSAAGGALAGLPGAGGSFGLGIGAGLSVGLGVGIGVGVGVGFGASASLGIGVGGSLSLAAGASAVASALDGESLSQLALRSGLAPEAWRALSAGVADPTRLAAGREVALPATASAGPGVGAGTGVQAGTQGSAAPSAAQRVGLASAASIGARGALQTGYAMAAAGGLGAALETVKADAGTAGATQARRDFAGAGGDMAQATDPLSAAVATPGQRQQVFSLRADPRAQSFGRGVPLRDRVQTAQEARANLLAGQAFLKRQTTLLPPTTSDPGVPGWVALPLAATELSPQRHPRGCRCGCAR